LVRKGNLRFILMFFGTLLAGGLLNWTFEHAYGDTNLQFAISECPVLSNGVDEESGQCPDIKTIQNEGKLVGNEQSDTRPTITSGLVNPFGP
jgi:hypothetical protein